MGLDVTAYERAVPYDGEIPRDEQGRPTGEWYDEAYENGVIEALVDSEAFAQSLRGLTSDAWYQTSGATMGFRAGSYGGYGQFRTALCLAALGVTPQEVWRKPEDWTDKPFYELINFSDCEGTIGSEACVDLARDFQENANIVLSKWGGDNPTDTYFRERYQDWQAAFELAARGGGLVELH